MEGIFFTLSNVAVAHVKHVYLAARYLHHARDGFAVPCVVERVSTSRAMPARAALRNERMRAVAHVRHVYLAARYLHQGKRHLCRCLFPWWR